MSFLLTFEGIDGAGKSTQIERVRDWLVGEGWEAIVRREPGGTDLGEAIRAILLDPKWSSMHGRCEYLLYSASRAQLVEEVVKPNLNKPRCVIILDRFFDSSTAYQGGGRQIGESAVAEVHAFVTDGVVPDLTLYLDIDWDTSRSRRSNESPDRLEGNSHEFFERVRAAYHHLVEREPARFVRIDASRSADEVFGTIQEEVRRRCLD